MDLLKREMERKKKALQQAKKEQPSVGRFLKAGEIRRLQEEQEDNEREKRKRDAEGQDGKKRQRVQEAEAEAAENKQAATTEATRTVKDTIVESTGTSIGDLVLLPPAEVTRRFRSLGHSVRLFGERTTVFTDKGNCDDSDRLQRLRQALDVQTKVLASLSEKDEYRLGSGHTIRNPFLEKDEAYTTAVMPSDEMTEPKDNGENGSAAETTANTPEDNSDDPHKLIYKYFKGLLKSWEDDLANRPEEIKRSVTGKNETKTLKQCKDYVRPLFKLCKSRRLEVGLTMHLTNIVNFCHEGEFVKAHDSYLDVAIGRAAWPIGVTMVGIHARTGRAKIESQNVAHVMNSELQRKYLTSVKRLMTYDQKKRTDVDPSKKVT